MTPTPQQQLKRIAEVPIMGKYDEVLVPFKRLMETELHANAVKGDRPGWLSMTAEQCLLKIYYHVSKLQRAVRDGNGDRIKENTADVANMAMMLADICGALAMAQPSDGALTNEGAEPVALTVWYGSMPESNGKTNWTAILHRKGDCLSEGITIDRSEYSERTRYEADRMSYLIGEIEEEPDILAYDAEKHSGYARPPASASAPATCTCPSGDGSLRWPCPVHPPEVKALVLPEGLMIVERGIWTEEQVDSAAKCIELLKDVPGMTARDLAITAMDAGQCKAPDISLSDFTS